MSISSPNRNRKRKEKEKKRLMKCLNKMQISGNTQVKKKHVKFSGKLNKLAVKTIIAKKKKKKRKEIIFLMIVKSNDLLHLLFQINVPLVFKCLMDSSSSVSLSLADGLSGCLSLSVPWSSLRSGRRPYSFLHAMV